MPPDDVAGSLSAVGPSEAVGGRGRSKKSRNHSDLEFILFALNQAKAAVEFGFTPNWACRNLKVAIRVFWEERRLGFSAINKKAHFPRSRDALQAPIADCVAEHTVPMQWIVNRILKMEAPTTQDLEAFLTKYYLVTLVTRDEDQKLRDGKLRSTMPDDWDKEDLHARYRAVGIELPE